MPQYWRSPNRFTRGSMCWPPLCSLTSDRRSAQQKYTLNWPGTWPELASRVNQGQLGPLHEVGDAPTAKLSLHQLSLKGWRWTNIQGKNLWLGNQDQEGDIPILGIGMSCNNTRVPHPNILTLRPSPTDWQALLCLSQPSAISPHWQVAQLLPEWSSPAPPATGILKQDVEWWHPHTYWRMPPPQQEPMDECQPKEPVKKQDRFNLDEDLGDDPSLPMDLTTFLEGALPKSGIMLQAPLFPWLCIPHSCFMTMATSANPHTWEEFT